MKRATELAVAVYRLSEDLPVGERFDLAAQMRRAAVSVGSNVAEGCGHSSEREFIHFLRIARGSSTELAFQLGLAKELGFASAAASESVGERIDHVQRMLNKLTNAARQELDSTK